MSEPVTSLKCPGCGALVPLFDQKPRVTCNACGAEFPVRYVEAASVAEVPPLGLVAFALWLASRFRK